MSYELWARKLRTLREHNNLRQEDIAKKIRISRPHYCAIECARSVVNYNHLLALAKAFKLSLAEMVTLEHINATSER